MDANPVRVFLNFEQQQMHKKLRTYDIIDTKRQEILRTENFMRYWYGILTLTSIMLSCKLKNSTELKSQDHLDSEGPFTVTQGTPQKPEPHECVAKIVNLEKTDHINPFADFTKMNKIVDLAWQFPDIKSQQIGDCYVYAGAASVEAAMNRIYLTKPQIGLAEPYITTRMFMMEEHMNEFIERLLHRPLTTFPTPRQLTDGVYSGGSPEDVMKAILSFRKELVFLNEFSYEEQDRFINALAQAIKEKRTSTGLTYGTLDGVLRDAESLLSKINHDSPFKGVYEGLLTFRMKQGIEAIQQVDDEPFRKILRKAKGERAKDEAYKNSLAALDGAQFKQLVNTTDDGFKKATSMSQAWRDLLQSSLKAATYLPSLPVDNTIPDPKNESQTVKTPNQADPLSDAQKVCAAQSEALRRLLAGEVCQGIPVVVSLPMDGVLEPILDVDSGLSPSQSTPSSVIDEDLLKELNSASRGDAGFDPAKQRTYLRPFDSRETAQHALHAMIIDGVIEVDGALFWRMRNSWAGGSGSGSIFIPFSESCRIYSAASIALAGERN